MTRRLNISSNISLVEMLIVLAALLTLALLLQPRASLAGDQRLKGQLDASLTELAQAVAIYQMRTGGVPPALGGDDGRAGWTPLIAAGVLDQPPVNPYNTSTRIVIGVAGDAMSHGPTSEIGWVWDPEASAIHAAGYEPEHRSLFHERAFADVP